MRGDTEICSNSFWGIVLHKVINFRCACHGHCLVFVMAHFHAWEKTEIFTFFCQKYTECPELWQVENMLETEQSHLPTQPLRDGFISLPFILFFFGGGVTKTFSDGHTIILLQITNYFQFLLRDTFFFSFKNLIQ